MRTCTRAVVVVAATCVVLTSCTSRLAGDPRIAASSDTTTRVSFDPCAALSDTQLTLLGLDPSTKSTYGAGPAEGAEKGCRWNAPGGDRSPYTASIGVSPRSLQDYSQNPRYVVEPVSVPGRDAVNFTPNTSQPPCFIVMTSNPGVVLVSISPVGTEYRRDQSCPEATRIASGLASIVP